MTRYIPFYSETLKASVLQVTKTQAKKFFEQGKTIYLLPSKMEFDNIWQSPLPFSISHLKGEPNWDFSKYIGFYEIYNCDRERGRWVHFFIQI